MGLLSCRFPEQGQPLELAREFKQKLAPIVLDIDESDVMAANIAKIESALDAAGQAREGFQPLQSMKRNAALYAPHYRIVLRVDQTPLLKGAINRRNLNLTWDDPIPDWVLTKVLQFAHGIPAAEVEAEDDAGNPIEIRTSAKVYT